MENLTKHWQSLSLNAREGDELGLDDELSTKNFNMAGKFLTKWALNVEAVTKTFSLLWRLVKGFKVRKISDHVLLFTFEKKEEVERIMSNAPWSFDKHLVVLQWYDKGVSLWDLEFKRILIWVQIHDVPYNFMNKTVAVKLYEVVGAVCQSRDEGETDEGSFLRIKVVIDISKPLCMGRLISLSKGEQSWVSFKYERLPNICYWCGCLNHVDSDCDLWIESKDKLTKENQAYGAWIRATPFVKGRSSVLKVPGFYATKKAQKKKVVEAENVVVPPMLQVDNLLPTMVQGQTEVAAHFQGAFNEV